MQKKKKDWVLFRCAFKNDALLPPTGEKTKPASNSVQGFLLHEHIQKIYTYINIHIHPEGGTKRRISQWAENTLMLLCLH